MLADCILWTGTIDSTGYGRTSTTEQLTPQKHRERLAHRYAWTQAYGAIPKGMFVLHRCDDPPCVNVDHLFLGTHQDNMMDKIEKGRSRGAHIGEEHHFAKLTWDAVRDIRNQPYLDRTEQKRLAAKYGVSIRSIYGVVHGRTWKETLSK